MRGTISCHTVLDSVVDLKGADAIFKLIPPPDSKGKRVDEIDEAIWKIAGDYYQKQVLEGLKTAKDGEVIVAEGNGVFKDIIYVNDLGEKKLLDLVCAGLKVAEERGHRSVAMPMMRLTELPRKEQMALIADKMHTGVRQFDNGSPSTMEIFVTAEHDPNCLRALRRYNRH